MNNAQLINQDCGNFEYYTPSNIVDAARFVMGGIDLDPASSVKANERVRADLFYSANGLTSPWTGKVWMNHPFSREGNALWISRLINLYGEGFVTQACCITFASTSERWFRPLMDYPQCYLSPRTNYYLPDGTLKRGVTKGSVVTYLGPNIAKFFSTFRLRGKVMLPATEGMAA